MPPPRMVPKTAEPPTTAPPPLTASRPVGGPPTPAYGPTARTYFRNVSSAPVTVYGPVSGARYQFRAPGETLGVDPRDGAALDRFAQLRRVAHP